MLQISDVPKNQRLRYIQEVLTENNVDAKQAHLAEIIYGDRTKTGNVNRMFKKTLAVSDSFFEVFLKHYPDPPLWWKQQEPMPTGGIKRTLKDYVEHIEGENNFLRGLVESALSDISVSVKELVNRRISSVESEKSFEIGQEAQGVNSDLLLHPKFGGTSKVQDHQTEQDSNLAKDKLDKEQQKQS